MLFQANIWINITI